MQKQTHALLLSLIIIGLAGVFRSADATEEPKSSEDVIFNVENTDIFKDKEDYLLKKGNMFLEQGEFEEAKEVAEYVLGKLNSESHEAKKILQTAMSNIEPEVPVQVNPIEVSY